MFTCTTIGRLKEGMLDEVLKAAEKLAQATRKQTGNIYYYVYVPEGRTDCFATTEGWESRENFQEHVGHADDPADPLHIFNQVVTPASAAEPEIFMGGAVI